MLGDKWSMKTFFISLLMIGFCNAANTSVVSLSNLLNPGKIVKIDCYVGRGLTDVTEIGKLGKYLFEESDYFAVNTEDLLREFSLIFNRRAFVEARILVLPKLRTYNAFVISFSDKSQLTLIHSSGFGEDQFVVGEISRGLNQIEVKEIKIAIQVDGNEETVAVGLQGFQKSDFLRQVVKARAR
jgi:hypothetical protein